jgi:hypothetical protein
VIYQFKIQIYPNYPKCNTKITIIWVLFLLNICLDFHEIEKTTLVEGMGLPLSVRLDLIISGEHKLQNLNYSLSSQHDSPQSPRDTISSFHSCYDNGDSLVLNRGSFQVTSYPILPSDLSLQPSTEVAISAYLISWTEQKLSQPMS